MTLSTPHPDPSLWVESLEDTGEEYWQSVNWQTKGMSLPRNSAATYKWWCQIHLVGSWLKDTNSVQQRPALGQTQFPIWWAKRVQLDIPFWEWKKKSEYTATQEVPHTHTHKHATHKHATFIHKHTTHTHKHVHKHAHVRIHTDLISTRTAALSFVSL